MERPELKSIKDDKIIQYIEYLEKICVLIQQNSRAKTYIALRQQVDNWNEQITIRDGKLPNPKNPKEMLNVTLGYVDLFADKDTKDFDRVFKYITEADAIEDKLQKMFEKLLPDEKEAAAKLVAGSSAERHVFKTDKK